jgi:hypothetical protein
MAAPIESIKAGAIPGPSTVTFTDDRGTPYTPAN